METHQLVVLGIEELPKFPNDIAKFLERLGIKGRCGSLQECPISIYLQKLCGIKFYVTPSFICTKEGIGKDKIDNETRFTTPPNVRQFLLRFDHNAYPELVEERSDSDGTKETIHQSRERSLSSAGGVSSD